MATERSALLGVGGRPSQISSKEDAIDSVDVYHTIHRVYDDIVNNIDVPLSTAQLLSPEITFAIVMPLEETYQELDNPSIVFCLLLNRLQFMREADSVLASSRLNQSRAELCEMLAGKLLRFQAMHTGSSAEGLLKMARALVGGFHAFQGVEEHVLERIRKKEGLMSEVLLVKAGRINALELAILGKARNFIKTQATQRTITAIWEGKIVYSSSSFLDILPDKYKVQPISVYNLGNAPILDHYRLRVPKYRSVIEFFSFTVLFASFLAVCLHRRLRPESLPVSHLNGFEIWFGLFSTAYTLDKIASILEHGPALYAAGLSNGLDALCMPFFFVSIAFRLHSIVAEDAGSSDQAYAILSVAACFMFPRFAFATISDNVLILSLRAMLAQFIFLMAIAVFCFGGFVFALEHLSSGKYSVSRIAEWLIFIWFGLDGTGIDRSVQFHHYLGPALFTSYAALSNTLFVSLLVAIMSSTYATIDADSAAESMFRKAVMTFEGVKSDSLFDYVPPLNLVALLIMWPVSRLTSPRWFHKINVATTRILSCPILLLIALYERDAIPNFWAEMKLRITAALPTQWANKISFLEGSHWECEAVFRPEYSPEDGSDSDTDSLPSMEASDDSDDPDDPESRKGRATWSKRASRVISGNRPPPDASPAKVGSPSASKDRANLAPSPLERLTPPPTINEELSSSLPTHPSPAMSMGRHARFPTTGHSHNNAAHSLPHRRTRRGSLPAQRTVSPIRNESDFLLHVNANSPRHAHFASPLAKLYQPSDEQGPGLIGARRKMSMNTNRPPNAVLSGSLPTSSSFKQSTSSEPLGGAESQSVQRLTEMVAELSIAIKRLESGLARAGAIEMEDEEARKDNDELDDISGRDLLSEEPVSI